MVLAGGSSHGLPQGARSTNQCFGPVSFLEVRQGLSQCAHPTQHHATRLPRAWRCWSSRG